MDQRELLRRLIADLSGKAKPPADVELLADDQVKVWLPNITEDDASPDERAETYVRLKEAGRYAVLARRDRRMMEHLLALQEGRKPPHQATIDRLFQPEVKPDPGRRLKEICALKAALDEEKIALYRAAFRNWDDGASDVEGFGKSESRDRFMAELDDEGRPEEGLPWPFITYPITVDGLSRSDATFLRHWKPTERRPTPWVSIRPCDEETYRKDPSPDCPKCDGTGVAPAKDGTTQDCGCMFTWLGVYLGDMASTYEIRYSERLMEVGPSRHNPAIWIPEKHAIVFGYESWWGSIGSDKALRVISGSDIGEVFYVQAARELFGTPEVANPGRVQCILVREGVPAKTWWVEREETREATAQLAAVEGVDDSDVPTILVVDGIPYIVNATVGLSPVFLEHDPELWSAHKVRVKERKRVIAESALKPRRPARPHRYRRRPAASSGARLSAYEVTKLLEFLALANAIDAADTEDDIDGWLQDARDGTLGSELRRLANLSLEVVVIVVDPRPPTLPLEDVRHLVTYLARRSGSGPVLGVHPGRFDHGEPDHEAATTVLLALAEPLPTDLDP